MNHGAENVRINIALGTPIIFQLKGLEERYHSILLGMEVASFLLIKTPSVAQMQAPIKTATPLTVRFVSYGTVWGFHATVLHKLHQPARVLFISYPERVEHLSLRKHHRVQCCIPATVQLKGQSYAGYISDISAGGSRFKMRTADGQWPAVRPDDAIELSMPLLGLEGMQRFHGQVRSVMQDNDGLSVGIQFQNVPRELTERIKTYIQQIEAYEKTALFEGSP